MRTPVFDLTKRPRLSKLVRETDRQGGTVMLDKIEEKAMRIAGKGYLIVSVAALIYVLWRGSRSVMLAALISMGSFCAYCWLDPDEPAAGDEKDEDRS